jgi:regulator of protease activity HflC (stomatin/prohibitin superfamily)
MTALSVLIVVLILLVLLAGNAVRMVQQYERGVVLRFGRLQPRLREPGLQLIVPIADRMTKVSLQTVVMGIPAQGAITRDNVTLTVDAVVYYRVIDPVKAIINVQNYPMAVSQVAQTSLRAVIGRADLDTLLSDRERINAELKTVIDAPTEEPWGLHIERVEVKDVSLPEGMKRSMSRQAEAERERRARVIAADGEYQASTKLAQAAHAMADTPGALQLRLLQTVVDVAAEKNSTLVMPFPVELLRFFDHAATAQHRPVAADEPAPTTTMGPSLGAASTAAGPPPAYEPPHADGQPNATPGAAATDHPGHSPEAVRLRRLWDVGSL